MCNSFFLKPDWPPRPSPSIANPGSDDSLLSELEPVTPVSRTSILSERSHQDNHPNNAENIKARNLALLDKVTHLEGPLKQIPPHISAAMGDYVVRSGGVEFTQSKWYIDDTLSAREFHLARGNHIYDGSQPLEVSRFEFDKDRHILVAQLPSAEVRVPKLVVLIRVAGKTSRSYPSKKYGTEYTGTDFVVWPPSDPERTVKFKIMCLRRKEARKRSKATENRRPGSENTTAKVQGSVTPQNKSSSNNFRHARVEDYNEDEDDEIVDNEDNRHGQSNKEKCKEDRSNTEEIEEECAPNYPFMGSRRAAPYGMKRHSSDYMRSAKRQRTGNEGKSKATMNNRKNNDVRSTVRGSEQSPLAMSGALPQTTPARTTPGDTFDRPIIINNTALSGSNNEPSQKQITHSLEDVRVSFLDRYGNCFRTVPLSECETSRALHMAALAADPDNFRREIFKVKVGENGRESFIRKRHEVDFARSVREPLHIIQTRQGTASAGVSKSSITVFITGLDDEDL